VIVWLNTVVKQAGRQNHFKIIVGDFSSVYRSRQKFLCPVEKKTVLFVVVDEKNHFLQTNLQKTPSEKNVPNCFSVNLKRG